MSSVLQGARADSILELIAELKDSRTVLVSYHSNDPNAGMSNHKDLSKFKLYLCDTGLFATLMFKDRDFTENDIYQKLLSEVDFILARKNKICPIEVKSSGYKAHASLDAFGKKFSDRILHRYLIYTKDLREEQDLVCLPIYMTGLL